MKPFRSPRTKPRTRSGGPRIARPLADYADTVGVRRQLVRDVHGKLPGDPRDVGEAVFGLSRLEKPPLHLLVGRDAYEACLEKIEGLQASIAEWEETRLRDNPAMIWKLAVSGTCS